MWTSVIYHKSKPMPGSGISVFKCDTKDVGYTQNVSQVILLRCIQWYNSFAIPLSTTGFEIEFALIKSNLTL